MKFELALKHIKSGSVLTRASEAFTLKMKEEAIIRRTKNGAETVARVNSSDLQANDWRIVKRTPART